MTALQIEALEANEVVVGRPILWGQVIHCYEPAPDLMGACACRATICTNSVLKRASPRGHSQTAFGGNARPVLAVRPRPTGWPSVSYLRHFHLQGERIVFVDTNSGLPWP